jgi:hypothetical protein
MEGFPSIEDLRTWADHLEEVQHRLAPYFELLSHASGRWPLSVA